MIRTIVVNGTHLGARLNGIGTYFLNMLREWTVSPSDLPLAVYLHQSARPHVADMVFPDNVRVHWIGRTIAGEGDNVRRLLFSNVLAAMRPKDVIFNPSQLEATFLGARQIVTVHDLIPLLVETRFQRRQHYFYRWGLSRALRTAAAVVTGSRATQAALCSYYGLPLTKVRVIPYGVRTLSAGRAARRRRRKYVLFAGRLAPHRNIERLIAAFVRIQDRVEHDLVLAGETAYNVEIPRDNERIVVRGHVADDELHALYSGASAFAFPSLGEGFGFPPLEAMALGCPVVASAAGSLPEVCGTAAVWVDPRSIDSIANGLLSVLTDEALRSRLIAAGRTRAAELTWKRCAAAHLALFAEVVGSAGVIADG